jgi:ABC-type phosphate/phosphonate transport system substrate-binding protein
VAKAVYAGKVELGAGHDGVIVDLAGQPGFGGAKDRLQTVLESRRIPSDAIAVFVENETERTVLQEALVAAGKTPEGKDALAKFWGNAQGVSRTTPDAYKDLNKSVEELALSERDLIR